MESAASWRGEVAVAWSDCDPAGIAFYGNYFRWFDAGTHALLTGCGFDHRTLAERYGIVGASLVSVKCDFLRPVRFGQTLEHKAIITRVGLTSFTVAHSFSIADGIAAAGEENRVCVGLGTGGQLEKRPIPTPLVSALGSQ